MAYSRISSQRSMAFDERRNALYAKAIRRLVKPDSIVLDLGAGVGVHGLVAAAAGARRVYLVEPEPVVQIARNIAKSNDLDDRIVVIEGKIEEVELPEQVDLIISVFTGNLLYSEDLLPSLFHARDRFLKPGGKLIPDFAELVLAPVSAAEMHYRYVGRWSDPNLGLDFSAGRRFAANEVLWPRREDCKARQLGPEQVVSSLDLTTAAQAHCLGEAHCTLDMSGLCHGLLGWIRIRLADEWLGTGPEQPDVHWSPAFLPLDPPMPLDAGEEIVIKLQRPAWGDWTWTVTAASGTRRHSSFLSRLDGLRRLRQISPENRPGLNRQGRNTLRALGYMQQGRSNEEITRLLGDANPESFLWKEEAELLLQKLALRFGEG